MSGNTPDLTSDIPLTESKPPSFTPTLPSYPQSYLLQLVKIHDFTTLSAFLSRTLPQLPSPTVSAYTALDALQSPVSAPALLLLAATCAEAPEIFTLLWATLYAACPTNPPAPPPSSSSSSPSAPKSATTRIQIPYACLKHAARKGNLALARAFVDCEPNALSRSPPPAPHGGGDNKTGSGSQILTALQAGRTDYVDFMLAQGIDLNHEWPRVRLVRTVAGLEISDAEQEARLRWLVTKGARVRGSGVIQKVARDGGVGTGRMLLEAGVDVEDLEEGSEEGVRLESPLMEAIRAGNVDMMRLLVEWGANVEWRNDKGETPIGIVQSEGMDEAFTILSKSRKYSYKDN
ncbi:MAG: hypothetical protein Q9165_008728 [Trypethelium subeluteriae]